MNENEQKQNINLSVKCIRNHSIRTRFVFFMRVCNAFHVIHDNETYFYFPSNLAIIISFLHRIDFMSKKSIGVGRRRKKRAKHTGRAKKKHEGKKRF